MVAVERQDRRFPDPGLLSAPGNTGSAWWSPAFIRFAEKCRGSAKPLLRTSPWRISGDVTINLALQPGQLSQSVVVNADPVELQLNTKFEKPDHHPRAVGEPSGGGPEPLRAGFTGSGGSKQLPGIFDSLSSVAGHRDGLRRPNTRQNDVLIDGAPVQIGPKGSYTPTIDATPAHVVVEQVTVDAEFGHTAAGVITSLPARVRMRSMEMPIITAVIPI